MTIMVMKIDLSVLTVCKYFFKKFNIHDNCVNRYFEQNFNQCSKMVSECDTATAASAFLEISNPLDKC